MTLGTTWRICNKFTSLVQIEVFGQAYNSLRMSTSHFMKQRKEVSCTPLACSPVKLGWNNTFAPQETFGDSDDVSVWENVGFLLVKFRGRCPLASVPMKLGWNNFSTQWKHSAPTEMTFLPGSSWFLLDGFRRRFERSAVIHAAAAQFLFDIPRNLTLCDVSERVSLLSEVPHEILCKITASYANDGVMQSVTLVDVHCVRRTTLPRNGNVRRDSDGASVWEHGSLLLVKFRNRFDLCVAIQTNVGQILFDIPSTLPLCGGSEGVHTGSLGRHVRGGHVERLKLGLRHALSVSLGVQKSFRGQNEMHSTRNPEIVVE